MRSRTRIAGAALALALVGMVAGPAMAQTKDSIPKLKPTATAAEACDVVFGPDAFAKAPSEGEVSPGEPVSVDVTWGSGYKRGSTVEVVGCTAVDGKFLEELSTRIRRVKNDGLFVHEFSVPKDIAKGAKVCERAIVIGETSTGAAKAERLDADCFTVAGGSTAAAPKAPAAAAAKPPAPAAAAAKPPATVTKPAEKPAAGPTAGPAKTPTAAAAKTPASAAAPKPTQVAGATETKTPAAAAAPAPATAAAPANLARTGSVERALALAAGLLFVLGGLAVAFGRPRLAAHR